MAFDTLTRFRYLNRFAKKGQILFTGSSLMEHFPIEELRIAEDIAPIIYNRGISGFTTDDFLKNIGPMLLDLKPGKVFINIGTNDISPLASPDGKWLPRLTANYDKIISILKSELPDCEVYMMAYYPANYNIILSNPQSAAAFSLRTNENLALANLEVKKLAEKYHCHFINVNQGLADENGELKENYTMDGVHMYPDAYLQILRNLRPFL